MFEEEPAVGFPSIKHAVLPGKPEELPDQGELERHAEILTFGIKTPGAIIDQSILVRTPGMVNDAFVEHRGVGKALNIRQLPVPFRHARRVCVACPEAAFSETGGQRLPPEMPPMPEHKGFDWVVGQLPGLHPIKGLQLPGYIFELFYERHPHYPCTISQCTIGAPAELVNESETHLCVV